MLLGQVFFGDIFDDTDEIKGLVLIVFEQGGTEIAPNHATIFSVIAFFCLATVRFTIHQAAIVLVTFFQIFWMRDIPEMHANDLITVITEHITEPLIGPENQALGGGVRHADGCVFEGTAKALFTLFEGLG